MGRGLPAADDDRTLARFAVVILRMLLVDGGVRRLGKVLEIGVCLVVLKTYIQY